MKCQIPFYTQRAHDMYTTLAQRRRNVMMLHRR